MLFLLQIFVERKTHREDWTGEKSVKERFVIKEHELNDFCAGRMTMDAQLDEAGRKKGKKPEDVDKVKRLANEIQYRIHTRKLRPGAFASPSLVRWSLLDDPGAWR